MNILVSACLLGFDVKYSSKNNSHLIDPQKLERIQKMANIIPFCPEIYGGLETPRPSCEIKEDKVLTKDGQDRTEAYKKGAGQALMAARLFKCTHALLKEKSPSCGTGIIYDGSFTHTEKEGDGVTAALLRENNIKLYGESQIDELIEAIRLAKAPQQLSFEF